MIVLYNQIKNLEKVIVTTKITYIDAPILIITLMVFQNTKHFELALVDWSGKSTFHKTWANFESNFELAQKEIQKTHGQTMQTAGYRPANMRSAQLTDDIMSSKLDVLSML